MKMAKMHTKPICCVFLCVFFLISNVKCGILFQRRSIVLRACHTLAISVNDRVTREKICRTLANADYCWTIVMLSPCAFSDRCWSRMNADERWEFWTDSKLSTHTSVEEETLYERWVVATRSLYTLGERYSVAVHVRGALLSRCTR